MFNFLHNYRAQAEERRRQRLSLEVQRRIQLREFENKAYIAIDDIPLIPLADDIELLVEVRNTILRYWLS